MAFPDGFWWGTAASCLQCEGAAPASDWAGWEQLRKLPASGAGNGFGTSHGTDFALLAAHGVTDHRLNVDWARLEPAEGRHDTAAVEHYLQVLAAARDAGLRPWVSVLEGSVPGWFVDEGGFLDDRSRDRYWGRQLAFCAETFGHVVAGWTPLVEPVGYAESAYLRGERPPGRREPEDFAKALRAMHYAWRDAWRELRSGGAPVTTALAVLPTFPADDTLKARRAADRVDELVWRTWLRALTEGIVAVPGLGEVEVPGLAGSGDIVGVAYSHGVAVDGELGFHPYPRSARRAPHGFAPWSDGLGIVLHRVRDDLGDRPVMVAGHGIVTDDDAWRCDLLREALAQVEEAIDDRIDVRGYFYRDPIDGYDPRLGADAPSGLFDRAREPRRSADLYAEIAGRRPPA